MLAGVKSALRTFEIMELFAERRKPLPLHEIHTTLGYPQSSTTQLLKSMVGAGYLNYNRETRTYLPTTRFSHLGSWLPGYIQASGGYREMISELQRRTDETVALVTQNDLFIQYVILLTPSHEYKMAPRVGAMRKLVDSSSGIAMMSRMDDAKIDKLRRYSNAYATDDSERVSLTDLMQQIGRVRVLGYSHVPHRPTMEVSSIAMPLDADLYGIPLAIGVGGFAERIDVNRDRIVSIMRDIIAEFEQGAFAPSPMPESDDD